MLLVQIYNFKYVFPYVSMFGSIGLNTAKLRFSAIEKFPLEQEQFLYIRNKSIIIKYGKDESEAEMKMESMEVLIREN